MARPSISCSEWIVTDRYTDAVAELFDTWYVQVPGDVARRQRIAAKTAAPDRSLMVRHHGQLGDVRGEVGAADPPGSADLDRRQPAVTDHLEDPPPGNAQLAGRFLHRQEHRRRHRSSNRETASRISGSRLVVPHDAARRKRVPRVSSTAWRIDRIRQRPARNAL